MSKIKVTDIKQINYWLTEDGKLKSSMKTHVAMLNPCIDIIWIKFKNSLASNNDACMSINLNSGRLNIVKKYFEQVKKNKSLMELIRYYEEAGFISNADDENCIDM